MLLHFCGCCFSLAQLCPTLCDPLDCSMPGFLSFAISQNLFKLMSIKSVMPSSHLIFCCPLLLPSIFPSIRVFSNELALFTRWPKYWSFSFSISPCSEYSGLISFRIDWVDLAVQRTLKSLLQNHSSKASVFSAQLSSWSNSYFIHDYWKNCNFDYIDLCWQSNEMSLLFNMLSRFVTAFLPRSKCLLIWSLQSPSAVILEPKKRKSVTVFIVSSSICHEVMGPDAMISIFWVLSFKPTFSLSSFT